MCFWSLKVELERQGNSALEHVRAWGVKNKLTFAAHKTNAMVITRKLKFDTPRLTMGGVAVPLCKELKLLGVTIDQKLTFKSHVANVCRKALGVHKQLARAAKASWGLQPEVVRIIYIATVEPVILYAAGVWASAASKLGVIRQLNTVQRGIAQKICKAYRTTSLNSVLALAGLLPLDLRVREAAALYGAKRGVPQPSLKDRDVEIMAPAIEAPHPAERIDITLSRLVNQEEIDAQNEFGIRLYTDGSKIEGKVCAAISIWVGREEIKALKLKLSDYCSVYQAELLAICEATSLITNHPGSTFGLFSDSMAALQTIKNPSCLHPLAVQTRKHIKNIAAQNKTVSLFWVKAHAGLEGNERADELAKEAAINGKRKPVYDKCPISFVKRNLRMDTIHRWNERYISGETAAITKLFLPDALAAYRISRKLSLNSITTQIMTGHGGFSEYLHRFKCKESPSCICDPEVAENVPHILFSCPRFARERADIEIEIEQKVQIKDVYEIMMSKNRNRFMEYCIKIAKTVINKNK